MASNSRRTGKDMGRAMGKTTREIIETAQMTAKEAGTFSGAFIEGFRSELKKKKSAKRAKKSSVKKREKSAMNKVRKNRR